jgi:TnpA family transposase
LGNASAPIKKDNILIKDKMACREVLFGIADLLGFSYATRIKNFGEYKIYSNEGYDAKHFKADAVIDSDLIAENREGLIRFAATIKSFKDEAKHSRSRRNSETWIYSCLKAH